MVRALFDFAGFILLVFVAPVLVGALVGVAGSRLAHAALARRAARLEGFRLVLSLAFSFAVFGALWFLTSAVVPTQGDQTGISLRLGWLVLGIVSATASAALLTERRA